MSVQGKRLLVLGGTTASLDLVKNARDMGAYIVVAAADQVLDELQAISDECVAVSTIDIEGLKKVIIDKAIDGAFCGPSEFNLRNLLILCEEMGLPCYTTTAVWDHCANKDYFKQYCRDYDVDCPTEYNVSEDSTDEELQALPYPVIVKPVDACSSAGITTCTDWTMVREACCRARAASKRGVIIVEKFIENDGSLFSVRYLLKDGEAYPYFLMDTHVLDATDPKGLISHLTVAPSKHTEYYLNHMDAKVRRMLKGMGLTNGTAFIQSLPYDGKIYFHEMGYRLSGGMMFKLTEPLVGINDMKMMIAYALGEDQYTEQEMANIDLHYSGYGLQLMIPLRAGTITAVEGLEEIKTMPVVTDFIQYYQVGDTVTDKVIGTLGQHFGRFTIICDDLVTAKSTLHKIQETLRVFDENGQQMNCYPFDTDRI